MTALFFLLIFVLSFFGFLSLRESYQGHGVVVVVLI